MPMDALAEVLDALGWRVSDLHGLIDRSTLAAAEQLAERRGVPYRGAPSKLTGSDEIRTSQITVFATLRAAGFKVSWEQVCRMPISDFYPVADDVDDQALVDAYADAEQDAQADPQVPQTGSAPAVAAADTTTIPEPLGLQ